MTVFTALMVALTLFSPSSLHAYESMFELDPKVDVAKLKSSGEIVLRTSRTGEVFRADASAVLTGVDLKQLLKVSADFDRYAKMGMPNLKESQVVSRQGDLLYMWSYMATLGLVSRHYYEVRLHPHGSEWELASRRTSWPYEESTPFTRNEGSWFVKELPGGGIYVRYYIVASADLILPAATLEHVMKKQLGTGARQVIQILAREAAVRQ